MQKTTFAIPKMDCVAEEQMVRSALAGHGGIANVVADLAAREVTVVHAGDPAAITAILTGLNLGARAIATAEEARTLTLVLAINAAMFLAEVIAALLAHSSALLADSLDMFADAAVYAL